VENRLLTVILCFNAVQKCFAVRECCIFFPFLVNPEGFRYSSFENINEAYETAQLIMC